MIEQKIKKRKQKNRDVRYYQNNTHVLVNKILKFKITS